MTREKTTPWGTNDPLSRVLLELHLGGTFFCNTELGSPWALEIPSRSFASFHFISRGDCWLHIDGRRPLHLGARDLALLPRSPSHRLMDERRRRGGVPFETLPRQRLGDGASWLRGGGKGSRSVLICGGVSLGGYVASALMRLLPEIVVLRARRTAPIVASALEAMSGEARSARPGSLTLMTRFADIVVVHALRDWLETARVGTSGWLAALRDPQIGAALADVHERPGVKWTLERLADSAHMSRTTFAARFTDLVGVPAMQYVTEVRMQRAREILEREPLGLGQVAARLGYESESAFARAFKRHVGRTPGSVRRESARRSKLA